MDRLQHLSDVRRVAHAVKQAGIIPTGDIVVAPHAIGKTAPATYTTAPSKGQLSNPLKHSDVPTEVKRRLRRRSSSSLARAMQDAGGATAPEGDQFAAVLAERGVNPNLAATNMQLARMVPNDVYQRQKQASAALDAVIHRLLHGDA